MTDISLGPFSFPGPFLLFLSTMMVTLMVGSRYAVSKREIDRSLSLVIVLAVLVARLAFVLRYREMYISEPLRIPDIRDGGFSPWAGWLAAVAAAAWLAWRHPERRKALVAALTAGALVWGAGDAALSASSRQQVLPDITLTTLEGDPVRLSSMVGKPVIVNLWASWCPPCRREMPVLAKAQAENIGMVFVFANQGESAQTVKAYLASEGMALRNVLLDNSGVLAQETGSRGLPTTLFYNASGKLVERRTGEVSTATLAERLSLLREAPSPTTP